MAGLLALMLFTEARRTARISANGELVPLGEQDRGAWNAARDGPISVLRRTNSSLMQQYHVDPKIGADQQSACASASAQSGRDAKRVAVNTLEAALA